MVVVIKAETVGVAPIVAVVVIAVKVVIVIAVEVVDYTQCHQLTQELYPKRTKGRNIAALGSLIGLFLPCFSVQPAH